MSHTLSTDSKRGAVARFFTENRQIAWVVLLACVVGGAFAYLRMPKRKDPDIPVRSAVALVAWPGASAAELEEQVIAHVEERVAENAHVERIDTTVRSGVAVVSLLLDQTVDDTGPVLDDIWLKLGTLELPDGARIQFIKDFGDTSALMLTVASPKASAVEVQLRAASIRAAIDAARGGASGRAALLVAYPFGLEARPMRTLASALAADLEAGGAGTTRIVEGAGFMALDTGGAMTDAQLLATARAFVAERMRVSELHPDVWQLTVVRDTAEVEAKLRAVSGPRYTYAELEDMTEKLRVALQRVEQVAKVTRSGVQEEQIFLEYSQEKLASYGIQMGDLEDLIAARNLRNAKSVLDAGGRSMLIAPSGALLSEQELGEIVVGRAASGAPVYLRDLFEITRGYQTPSPYLNDYTFRDADGEWQRTRAITLSINMRAGEQIAEFGAAVDRALAATATLLPDDIITARVSDQPQQVQQSLDLFTSSLIEAIVLVVLVALIGFWEWRTALLMALSIPITLFMTFAMMLALGIDVQQVSIASLIIALGLLVDVPVVAGDAIKRGLAEGMKRQLASWMGPTKLAKAILFATITNIVAYLPFLSLPGDTGRFVYSLPIVLTCSLVAAFIVSMTFIPFLGYYLMRAPKQRAASGPGRFARGYRATVGWAIDHRWIVFTAAVALLCAGGYSVRSISQAFFPKDLSFLAYVDVWLPEDATIDQTRAAAAHVDEIVRRVADAQETAVKRPVLRSVTTFTGGGGPRFWFSLAPEQRQMNYAQVVIQLADNHDTAHFVGPLQDALARELPEARADVQQLESGPAFGQPVQIRISGDDADKLRELGGRLTTIMHNLSIAERVRDTWGADHLMAGIVIDADRAGAAGVTNADVAQAVAAALHGHEVGTFRDGDVDVPIVARLRAAERERASDLESLYVPSHAGTMKVPLLQVAHLSYSTTPAKIVRRNQKRTLTVAGFPRQGMYPSQVMTALRPELAKLEAELPPGVSLEIGGEEEEQTKSFGDLVVVLCISVMLIFLALVSQFKNAVKPFIVFSAIPFGGVAALATLVLVGQPFGFMAFLGLISLVGVIVSHVIVLFDFIEEKHEEGTPLRTALIESGLARLRPVLITVAATVLGLIPLAMHGGPLWEPLCYVQIGGLTIATVVTLLIVPVLYAIFVLDLRLVRWERPASSVTERSTRIAPHTNPSADVLSSVA